MANQNNPFPPSSLADFTISDPASRMQLESIVDGKVPFPQFKNAICLWGTYGTGKTTLAEMLPSMLEATGNLAVSAHANGLFASQHYCHVTMCGFGSNAVTTMQDLHKRAQSSVNISPKGYRYEILDEVDILTSAAQASLKSTVSHFNETIFIFTTNNPNKLDRGLVNRSFMIEMNQPGVTEMVVMGRRFLCNMGLTGMEISDPVFERMAIGSRGSIRDFGDAVATAGLAFGGVLP
jgi:replication-associated recombination protein RarA